MYQGGSQRWSSAEGQGMAINTWQEGGTGSTGGAAVPALKTSLVADPVNLRA